MTEPSPETLGKEQKPKVIVEFGPRASSLARFSKVVASDIEKGATYIGIDVDHEANRDLKGTRIKDFIDGSIQSIPLQDETADEVFLANVLSGFRARAVRIEGSSYVYEGNLSGIFTELHRILKPGGKAVIIELYPPEDDASDPSWVIEEDYAEQGFDKQVFEGEDLQNFVTHMGLNSGFIVHLKGEGKGFKKFAMILTKKA